MACGHFQGSLPDSAPEVPRLRGAPRARAIDGPGLRADRPLISPSGDLGGEAPVAERGDDQPAAGVGGIRLGMARRTERDQAVEIEVRAPLGALDDVGSRARSIQRSPKTILWQWVILSGVGDPEFVL